MKKDIHPKYGKSVIKCGCGAVHEASGTVKEVNIEICSSCHPFYTGQQKFVDTMGRVERFQEVRRRLFQEAGEEEADRPRLAASHRIRPRRFSPRVMGTGGVVFVCPPAECRGR